MLERGRMRNAIFETRALHFSSLSLLFFLLPVLQSTTTFLPPLKLRAGVSSLLRKALEMAEFPPNLDDGELWLPSDIFVNDVAADHHGRLGSHRFSSLDELSRRFSAFSVLPPRPPNDYTPPALCLSQKYFQRFMLPTQYNTVIRSPAVGCFGTAVTCSGAVHHVHDHRTLPLTVASKLLYDEYRLLHQAHMLQVESCVETRTRVLRDRSQNQLGASYQGRGMSRKDCGGTGVFLPRVAEYPASISDFRRKQGARNRLDIQISQQMNSIVRASPVAKQEEACHHQLPPEMVLPHDWTY